MSIYELAGHLTFVLIAISFLVKDILRLRFLSIIASITGIAYNFYVPARPLWLVIYWNIAFMIINIVQIAIIIKERGAVHFSDEEKELYETLFKNFAPFEFMKLLRVGKWMVAEKDRVLIVEKEPLDKVMLIYNGLVCVEIGGETITHLKDGDFIGEMSYITGGVASATVRAVEPTRYLAWVKEDLRQLLNRNPSMRFAMQNVLSTDLTKKLMKRTPSRPAAKR